MCLAFATGHTNALAGRPAKTEIEQLPAQSPKHGPAQLKQQLPDQDRSEKVPASQEQSEPGERPTQPYRIVKQYPHRADAFTQGLLFNEHGELLESSGQYGRSTLVRLVKGSGDQIEQQYNLPDKFFAEGAALFGNWLYLLTWRAGKCLILDPDTLEPRYTLAYSGQGWGLTANDKSLIMSNGSSSLTFRQANNFKVRKTLAVTEGGKPVNKLNELEWARGMIYANIWQSDDIVAIDPASGHVTQRVDLSALRDVSSRTAEALNGIAYHQQRDTFFVTGKYWASIYEIKLASPDTPVPAQQPPTALEGNPVNQ